MKKKALTGAKAGHWNSGSPNAEDALQEKYINKVTENCLQGTTGMKQGEHEK